MLVPFRRISYGGIGPSYGGVRTLKSLWFRGAKGCLERLGSRLKQIMLPASPKDSVVCKIRNCEIIGAEIAGRDARMEAELQALKWTCGVVADR